MKVTLLAHTVLNAGIQAGYSGPLGKRDGICLDPAEFMKTAGPEGLTMETNPEDWDADTLAEFAGRSCYQSFHKPNPATRENADYLANILAQGHESVLEHSSASFYVEGVSRALTHELIRHRHLSFSELSQRFVNVEDFDIVTPPGFDELEGLPWAESIGDLTEAEDEASGIYERLVERLRNAGLPRKQAREAARAVMPGGLETRIVVSGNLRAWRDVLKKRWSTHADAEIRQFAGAVLVHLNDIAPNSVQDIPSTPFGSEDA